MSRYSLVADGYFRREGERFIPVVAAYPQVEDAIVALAEERPALDR